MEIKDLSDKILKIQKVKNVKCPTCKKVATKPFHPFCSKKCSNIDLLKWLAYENEYENHNFSQ